MSSHPIDPGNPSCVEGAGINFEIGDESALRQAFRLFARTASSLERSYGRLQTEVERLRQELAEKNADLAHSIEERNQERHRLIEILDGLPCGVLVVFDGGKIWKANPEACRLLRSAGSPCRLETLDDLSDSLRGLLATVRDNHEESELQLAARADDAAWIAASHASLSGGMSIFIVRDITEHKRLERAQSRLRREQALAEISAILAHEVRNPLGSMELFLGLLADAGLAAEARQWVEYLQAGLRTLSATVNNVLHFHATPRAEFSTVDVGELLEWLVNFCGPLARLSGVTISRQDCTTGLSLAGDRHRLEQVLLNLALNSMKAMPNGGWMEVSARRLSENEIGVILSDNGPGIPASCLPKIFEAGFSTSSGPGLGLAVCRKIMEQHKGGIRAESSTDRGTRFILTFPSQLAEAGS